MTGSATPQRAGARSSSLFAAGTAILVGPHLDTLSFVMDYVEFRIGSRHPPRAPG
jgi:hypothetical protein